MVFETVSEMPFAGGDRSPRPDLITPHRDGHAPAVGPGDRYHTRDLAAAERQADLRQRLRIRGQARRRRGDDERAGAGAEDHHQQHAGEHVQTPPTTSPRRTVLESVAEPTGPWL